MHFERPSDASAQWFQDAIDLALEKRPALETVIKPFAAALIKKASIIAHLKEMTMALNLKQTTRLTTKGVPVVTAISFADLKSPLQGALAHILPVLVRSFPKLKNVFCAIETSMGKGDEDLERLAQAYLAGDLGVFQDAAPHTGASVHALVFTHDLDAMEPHR